MREDLEEHMPFFAEAFLSSMASAAAARVAVSDCGSGSGLALPMKGVVP
jgi:hypothetical protein